MRPDHLSRRECRIRCSTEISEPSTLINWPMSGLIATPEQLETTRARAGEALTAMTQEYRLSLEGVAVRKEPKASSN